MDCVKGKHSQALGEPAVASHIVNATDEDFTLKKSALRTKNSNYPDFRFSIDNVIILCSTHAVMRNEKMESCFSQREVLPF